MRLRGLRFRVTETYMSLPQNLSRLLARELDAFQREIELFPDDESVWRVVPGVTNSAGTLALHISGNLQHFIGAVLGGTGYVRNREAEFATRGVPRADLTQALQAAREVTATTLASLDPAVLLHPYPTTPKKMTTHTKLF